MPGSAQPERSPGQAPAVPEGQTLDHFELQAALQLLVERAQFITGATGACLALQEDDHMVCRASFGPAAPGVGTSLQVGSGLTGESITRRQMLRCDNAESDPRVDLEACRRMGIASMVVMPLIRSDGKVAGLFELFSDHPYAFEERDLSALERMAGLALTALELAESSPRPVPVAAAAITSPKETPQPGRIEGALSPAEQAGPQAVPDAMSRVQKCSSCGFPVSDGRTICIDCEKKQDAPGPPDQPASIQSSPMEYVPAFLASPPPARKSWFTDPVNLLAILVVILGILVAIVVFR